MMDSGLVLLSLAVSILFPELSATLQATQFLKFRAVAVWTVARDYCLAEGQELATVDQYVDAYLKQAFAVTADAEYNTDSTWIGLHDAAQEYASLGTEGFRWSTCEMLGQWTNWKQSEPTQRYNNWCVQMRRDAGWLWYPEQCTTACHFLCQKSLGTCNTFRNVTGCNVTSAYLKEVSVSSSVASESDCSSACLMYIKENSPDLCWAYRYLYRSECTALVGTIPVFCLSDGGKMSTDDSIVQLRIRDCYSIKYNGSWSLLPISKLQQSGDLVNCSGRERITTAMTDVMTENPSTQLTLMTTEQLENPPTSTQLTSMTTEQLENPPTSTQLTSMTTKQQENPPASTQLTSMTTEQLENPPASTHLTSMTMENKENPSASTQLTSMATEQLETTLSLSKSPLTSSSLLVSTVSVNATASPSTQTVTTPSLSRSSNPMKISIGQCPCTCQHANRDDINTSVSLADLLLDKSKLSSTRRRKESAPDDRVTAQTTGGFGIAFIAVVLCLIVVPDIKALVHDIYYGV